MALRNEFAAFSRRADAKIGLLKEVIERVQRGEEVDVKGLLGTGDPEKEKEWEQGSVVIQELEEEDRLWQSNARRRQRKEEAQRSGNDQKPKDVNAGPSSAQQEPDGALALLIAALQTGSGMRRCHYLFSLDATVSVKGLIFVSSWSEQKGIPLHVQGRRQAGSRMKRIGQISSFGTKSGDISTDSISPRWLSDLRSRLGKCIIFGLRPSQIEEASAILRLITRDWRALLAGSEGFLIGRSRAGFERHQIVWGEMDSMQGHVNNVQYVRYAESARINWAQNYAKYHDTAHAQKWRELWTPHGDGLILRSIKTDFKFPMTWPDRISVYHKLRNEPDSATDSFVLDVLILSERHQRAAARCVEDLVVYDYRNGKKTCLPPFMLEQFSRTWQAQQATRRSNEERLVDLTARVRRLEKASWDKEGAVEDVGTS
ncbi:MAG: hypothetical protein Q9174_003513 [Haloplaca sp. 1 TL-2023]